MLSTNARKIHPTVPEKETEGVSLRKASTETFSLGPVHAKKRHKVPMTFHQRLLPNWQNRCDTSQLQLIRRTTRASQLSTFSAATHSSPAAAPGPWAHPPPPQSTQLHPGRRHCARGSAGTALAPRSLAAARRQGPGFETRRRDSEGFLYLHPSARRCPSQSAGDLSSSRSHNAGSRPLFVPQI